MADNIDKEFYLTRGEYAKRLENQKVLLSNPCAEVVTITNILFEIQILF